MLTARVVRSSPVVAARVVRSYPVLAISTLATTLVVMFFTYFPGIHLTSTQLASVATIATAVAALIAAFLVTPVDLGVISGIVSTILVAATSFGLHLPNDQIAAVAAAIVAVLGYILHGHVSPASRPLGSHAVLIS